MRAAGPLIGAACLLALAVGCQAPPQPTGPTSLALDVVDYDAFVDRSLSLLRRYDLPPDRVDRQRGLIVTEPTTSGQWFELWRADARGGYQLLESSLHTTQRVVTVQLEPLSAAAAPAPATSPAVAAAPADDPALAALEIPPTAFGPGPYRLTVRVDKYRYAAPERQVTTTSGAMGMYSQRVPTVYGRRGPRSVQVEWVPQGRDALLEEWLLTQFAKAAP